MGIDGVGSCEMWVSSQIDDWSIGVFSLAQRLSLVLGISYPYSVKE